ncbi:hypothetical protein F7725_019256 [Dissostichus mawsoni]|uniref:Uncharacterized protein n=1 Tax=Dissostichus mawsoni TaxID=36200 RepID=A0A7J5YM97_DISMA|nr:hypothetical protein F7725_019256 [Dissostichus mawsoni]
MQTTILQMFKRKREMNEETQNVLKIRKTTPTDDTVEAQRGRGDSARRVAAGPSKPPQVMLALLHTLLYGKKNNMNSSNRKMMDVCSQWKARMYPMP